MGAVPNKGGSLLSQSGDDQLAAFSIRYVLSGMGINDLEVQVIVPIVHAAFVITAHSDTRTVNFRQAVNIVKLDAKLVGNAAAHFFAPALRADHALSQMDLILNAALGDFLR